MSPALRRQPDDVGKEPIPLVIVEGFLGGTASAILWGKFEDHLNSDSGGKKRKCIFASVGPVSSLHDRACELYYALKGGTVDYGEQHSLEHGHSRYGRKNIHGLYSQWSREQPLHFLGHSMGGPTVIKLQRLLDNGFFGHYGHPDMILSLTAVSAPFRGTQLVYTLGERADAAPAVRPLSVGSALAKGVHIMSFFSPFLPGPLDLHAESRRLSYHESSVFSLLKQLWRSDWAESRDATPFDVTFEAADERESNLEGVVYERTFYKSYVASMTQRRNRMGNNWHSPPLSHLWSPLIYFSSRMIGSFDYSMLRPIPSFIPQSIESNGHSTTSIEVTDIEQGLKSDIESGLGEQYWENDGIVPVFSQWHPFSCSFTRCHHPDRNPSDTLLEQTDVKTSTPEPGIWHVRHLDEASHSSLVPLWLGSQRQRMFWNELGSWLRAIDKSRVV